MPLPVHSPNQTVLDYMAAMIQLSICGAIESLRDTG